MQGVVKQFPGVLAVDHVDFAQQRMNFTRAHVEIDMINRQHAWKLLDDTLHLQLVDSLLLCER